MTAFTPVRRLVGIAAPLVRDSIDTDAIIPSREIRSVGKTGRADGLFAAWRYLPGTREPDPDFVLNQPAYATATILLGGSNFGCGSSREHAVWALAEYGVRAIVAPSFAPIFRGNCVRNGILPIVLDRADIATLASASTPVAIDLAEQTIVQGDARSTFAIDGQAKAMLLGGLDAIDLTLVQADAIAAFQARDRTARPWIYLEPSQ